MEKKNKLPDKKGFVYLWRKVWNNPIGKRAKYFAVFFFIVSHANWQDKYIIVDNKKKLIKRGQWLGSIKKIAEQFDDISYATAHYIVKYLKVDMMIDTLSTKKYTLFTVINYDKWQGVDMLVDNKLISKLYQIDTTNNINNRNNINNKDKVIPKGITRQKPRDTRKPHKEYGNTEINSLIKFFKERFGLPLLDGSERQNRRYCHLAIVKFGGADKVRLLIETAANSDFWSTKISSFMDLYYKGVRIINETRSNKGVGVIS